MTDTTLHAKAPRPVADEEHGAFDLIRFLPKPASTHEWVDEVLIGFYPDGSFQGAHAVRYRIARSPFDPGGVTNQREMVELTAEALAGVLPDRAVLLADFARLDRERDRLGEELATAENALADARQELAEAQAYIAQIEAAKDALEANAALLQQQADQAMASRMPTGA